MVFIIDGHGGHLQIMTYFCLILYMYHINAKYEILSKKNGSVLLQEMSFEILHERLPWQPKLLCNFHKNFIYVIRTLVLILL